MKYTQELIDTVYKKHITEQVSISKICRELKLDRNAIKKYFDKYGYKSRNYKIGGQFIIEDYFESINTEAKAYILGLIYADGCITSSKSAATLSITLHKKDKYIIEFIAEQLGKNIKIYSEGQGTRSTIKINRDKIVNDLILLGVEFNKSIKGNLKLPNINKKLMPHFVRGFMDGDGTVSKLGHVCFYSTSKTILEELQLLFTTLGCSNKVNIHEVKNVATPYYHLHYARKNSSNIIYPYLYDNSTVCMYRKKERFIR